METEKITMNDQPPRKFKRKKVMSESDQTEAERRSLRIKQRQIKAEIREGYELSSGKVKDVNSGLLDMIRNRNNDMYKSVTYTREAVLDGENIELIANKAARQIDSLMSVPRYDPIHLASKLKSKCAVTFGTQEAFDWTQLGVEVGSCFNAIPSNVSFLNGTIDCEYEPKQRKKIARRSRSTEEEIEEEVGCVQQKKKNKDQDNLSAAEKHVSVIRKLLTNRSEADVLVKMQDAEENFQKEKHDWSIEENKKFRSNCPGEICAIKFLFNPKSFTQTVENLFGLSFLVKEGSAKVGVRSENDCNEIECTPGPWVKKRQANHKNSQPNRQAIVSLSMEDWKTMVEAYELEESDIPHRGRSKSAL